MCPPLGFRPVAGAFPHLCPGTGCAVCAWLAGHQAEPDPDQLTGRGPGFDPTVFREDYGGIFRSDVPPATGVLTFEMIRDGFARAMRIPVDNRRVGASELAGHREGFRRTVPFDDGDSDSSE